MSSHLKSRFTNLLIDFKVFLKERGAFRKQGDAKSSTPRPNIILGTKEAREAGNNLIIDYLQGIIDCNILPPQPF